MFRKTLRDRICFSPDEPVGGTVNPPTPEEAAAAATAASEAAVKANPFLSSLPEDLRTDPFFKDFKDVGGLAKSARDTAKMVGVDKAKLLVMPDEKSTPEQKAAFYERLGRPVTPDKYVIDTKDIPVIKGFVPDEGMKQSFLAAAHADGLNNQQVNNLYKWYMSSMGKMAEGIPAKMQENAAAADAALTKEWGAAKDQNLAIAQRALAEYGSPELTAWLEETRQGDNPHLIKAFHKAGLALSEDKLSGGRDAGAMGGALSPQEAQMAIAQKYQDPEFMKAYQNKSHAGHLQAVAEMQKLFEYQYPQPKK